MIRTRLCLVTPANPPPAFAERLAEALAAGDVASVLIAGGDAERLAPVVQQAGAAAIAVGTAGRNLDGIHVEDGAKAVAAARSALGPDKIVGAGGASSRHDAMTLGELLPDYLFFGRLDGDTGPEIHDRSLDLAAWWAELFEIPAMVMGGNDISSVEAAAAARIEFVALREAVWNHPEGAAAAVAAANALLDAKVTA